MSLKILFVINGLGTGGAERSLAEMLPQLKQADISPIIVCFYRRTEGVERAILEQGFDVRFLNQNNFISRVRSLRQIIRIEKPNLLHTTIYEADITGRLAAVGIPCVVLSSLVNTSYDAVRFKDPIISATRLRGAQVIDAWTARHLTTHFHAITRAVKIAAVETMRVSPERITVIERGRDPHSLGYPSAERRRQARIRLNLQENDEVIVNVGRQEYQKGQRYLIEAMSQLTRSRPHSNLLVAGRQGHASAELKCLQEQTELNDRVRFLGHRDDIPEILAAADLFVFPSLYEGLGGALIEAMALGLPIIASDIPAVREVTEDNGNALLVKPTSPGDLVTAMAELLENREKASAFAQRSRAIFEERFTLERSTERMIELYYQLVALNQKKR